MPFDGYDYSIEFQDIFEAVRRYHRELLLQLDLREPTSEMHRLAENDHEIRWNIALRIQRWQAEQRVQFQQMMRTPGSLLPMPGARNADELVRMRRVEFFPSALSDDRLAHPMRRLPSPRPTSPMSVPDDAQPAYLQGRAHAHEHDRPMVESCIEASRGRSQIPNGRVRRRNRSAPADAPWDGLASAHNDHATRWAPTGPIADSIAARLQYFSAFRVGDARYEQIIQQFGNFREAEPNVYTHNDDHREDDEDEGYEEMAARSSRAPQALSPEEYQRRIEAVREAATQHEQWRDALSERHGDRRRLERVNRQFPGIMSHHGTDHVTQVVHEPQVNGHHYGDGQRVGERSQVNGEPPQVTTQHSQVNRNQPVEPFSWQRVRQNLANSQLRAQAQQQEDRRRARQDRLHGQRLPARAGDTAGQILDFRSMIPLQYLRLISLNAYERARVRLGENDHESIAWRWTSNLLARDDLEDSIANNFGYSTWHELVHYSDQRTIRLLHELAVPIEQFEPDPARRQRAGPLPPQYGEAGPSNAVRQNGDAAQQYWIQEVAATHLGYRNFEPVHHPAQANVQHHQQRPDAADAQAQPLPFMLQHGGAIVGLDHLGHVMPLFAGQNRAQPAWPPQQQAEQALDGQADRRDTVDLVMVGRSGTNAGQNRMNGNGFHHEEEDEDMENDVPDYRYTD